MPSHCSNRNVSFHSIFAFLNKITVVFKTVCPRFLRHISATLVLSAFLTACGGGGGGGGSSDTPAPTVPSPSLSLAVSSSTLTVSEDFSPALRVATATNATGIRVSQSTTGVVSVSTSVLEVSISSIRNASGRTTLTIVASNSSGSTTAQVVVTITAVNDPPTLVVSSNSISTLGGFSPITINTTASDIEDANLTFTVAESTTGVVRVTTSTNAIVLNTISGASGQTTLTLRVVDSSGSTVTEIITVSVTITPSGAPVLMVSTNLISVIEDFKTSVIIQTTATDVDGDTITVSVSASMPIVNAVISTPANGRSTITNSITLTAIADANGTATLTVLATDSGGQSTNTEVVVVVSSVEDAPTLTIPTATLRVSEDFDGAISVATAMDTDDDTLLISVVESTTGIVTVTTTASGVSVSSIFNANGQTTFMITVNDGTQDTTAQVVVTVAPVNDTPTLTIPSVTLTVVEDFMVVMTVATATDVDGNTLTFTVIESTTEVVTLSTSTSEVRISSRGNANGITTLAISVSDGFLSSTGQVVVTVTAVNDTPVLTISTTALILDEDFATTQLITVNRSDVENDTLTFSIAQSMSGIVSVSTSSAGVQVAPLLNANGQTTLTIMVSDGQASVSTQVVITVNAVNDTPTLTVSSNNISTLGGFSPITIYTTASDVEDANISFTVIDANTGVVTVTTSAEAIVLNTIPGASGQTTLTLRVVDSSGTTVTQSITVNVTITISAAPVLTVSTNLISVPEDFGTSVIIQTTATDGDATDTITVSVSASRPILTAVISTPANGQSTITNSITLTAIGNANGTATLTVLASDSGGQSHSTEIVIVVSPVQDAPTVNIPTATLTIAEDFASTQTIATASDDDGDTLLISVVESTTGIVTVTTSTSGVSVSSIRNANGQTTLTITVNDGNQDTTAQVVVDVTPVNDPPNLNIPSTTLTRQEDFVSAMTIATASDIDSTILIFTVTESTTGVIRVTTSSSEVRISSRGQANGVTTLVITVSDGRLSTTAQVVVTVTPVNDPPTLKVSTMALTLNEDFATVLIGTTRTDIDSNTLTLTVAESATGVVTATITDTGVQVANIAHANGVTTLTLSLSDGDLTTTTQVVVTVTPVNDPPALSVSTTALTLNEDFATTEVITVSRSDIDSNTLTITVAESATGVVTVTITDAGVQVANMTNINGVTTLTISLSDGRLSTTTQVVVTIIPVNDPPALSVLTTALTLNEDFATTEVITVSRSDIDSNTLTLTVAESATGVVTVTTTDSGVQVVSIADANGRTTLTITVSDSQASASTQVVVTVNPVNDTPTLTISSNSISTVGGFSPITINTTASDIDEANISFTVINANTGVVKVTTSAEAIVLNSIPGASGQTTLTVRVVDSSGATVTEIITVSVSITVSAAPMVTVSTNLISVPEDFRTSVIIQTTATDADGDTITVSVSASRPIVTAVISTPVNGQNTITNRITMTAITDANGTATLTVLASDSGGQSTNTEIVVVVSPVQDAPSLNIPSATLTVAEDFGSTQTVATASDDDGDTLLISVVESTTGIVTVTTSASGVSVSSIGNANGQTTLTITVNDGTQDTTAQVVVNVTAVNDPPNLNIPSATITALEDFVSTMTVAIASDVEGNSLTFTVTESSTGVIRVTTSTSEVRISSRGEMNGVTTLYITVTDGSLSTTAQVVVTVTPVNDPPALSVSTTALTLNEDFATVLIGTTRSDIDNNTLTLTVAESTTGVVTVTITDAGVQVANNTNSNGVTTLTLSLSDSVLTTTAQVVVTVSPVNDPPSINVSTTALTLNEDFTTTQVITVSSSDIDSNTLTLTVAESTTGVVTVSTSTSEVRISRLADRNGVTTLAITISDGELTTTAQVVITVTAVNDTPTLTIPTAVLNLVEDFATVLIRTTRIDIDSNTLTLTVAESATGVVTVTITDAGVLVANMTNTNGVTTLTISLSDGELTTSVQVVVTVTPVNDPPTLTIPTANLVVVEDFLGTSTIATATDVENATLTFSVIESTTGVVTVTTSTSGVFVSSRANANGQTTLTITVRDDMLSSNAQVVVTVTPVHDTPTLTVSTKSITTFGGFAPITIDTTASDAEDGALNFSVQASTSSVIRVTTSANAIVLNNIPNVSGQTTLTVRTTDNTGRTAMQTITVNVVIVVSAAPVVTVSTNLIRVDEDFSSPVVIRTTATDADGDALIVFINSPSHLVKALLSTPASGISSITNMITLTALSDLNGTTTLTIQATDAGGISTTEQIVVVVNPVVDDIRFSLSTSAVTLSVPGSQLDRIVSAISISNPDNKTLRARIGVTANDYRIFARNPIPVVSFTTNALTTTATLTSAESTAHLYFTMDMGLFGGATLTVQLTDLDTSITTQQTMVVQVRSVNVPPVIAPYSSNLFNYEIYSGRIYANTVQSVRSLNPLLTEARALGGHLVNINSEGELQFIQTAEFFRNVLVLQNTWWGLVLPQREFPGELFWITHDNTIAYGHASANGLTNLTVYPGHYQLPWNAGTGLIANRIGPNGGTATTINGTVYANNTQLQLLGDGGDSGSRIGLYEFPQGLLKASNILTYIEPGSTATVRLTGYDLNGDNIQLSDWSAVATTGTVIISLISQVFGLQNVNMMYTPPANFNSQSTVVVTLRVNGQNTTTALLFRPDNFPIIDLSTNAISIAQRFTNFVIGTTITDEVDGILPFTVRASTLNALIITTSANAIRLSGAPNFSGTVTLTVQATDSIQQTALTTVVISVQAVNDTPTLVISTDNISILGGFSPITIYTTATDFEDGDLPFSVQASPQGVVSITTSAKTILLSPILRRSGQTTLTVTTIDSLNAIAIQTIAINLIVFPSSTPVLTVSTNKLSLQEDFTELVIGTASDADSDTLVVTVSSSTYLVDAVFSTQMITLRSVANLFGTATLTVRATDPGGLFDTTEIVVVVNAVNDTPTLTVSTKSITTFGGFAPIFIDTTATDAEDGALNFSVQVSTSSVIRVTTSANAIVLNNIPNVSGQTTLTVRTTDNTGRTAMQTIAVNVVIVVSAAPVVTVSTNLIRVDEDFGSPVVIRTTVTDADSNALIILISSSSRLVDAVLSTPVRGVSPITNMITLTALSNLNGTTTLTIQATDAGGISTTEQIVVVVNGVDDPISFSLSTSLVTLSALGNQVNRNIQSINLSNPGNDIIRAQLQISSNGSRIFSANPAPVVSFTTNAITTETTLNSSTQAQLYFSIAPNQTGTATLTVQLNNLTRSEMLQQTMVVQVNSVEVPPVIAQGNTSIQNLIVHGGRLYANSVETNRSVTPFLAEARALGGHLVNINTTEEFNFLNSTRSGLGLHLAWIGLTLPQLSFPGELFWITNDSTIAYGFSSADGATNFNIHPGHYALNWHGSDGLVANRRSSRPSVFNWAVYSQVVDRYFLIGDRGDSTARPALYEFPQGLAPASITPLNIFADSSATIRLTGIDLNGGTINTTDWSAIAATGTVSFNNVSQTSGVQTVDLVYTPPIGFIGQSSVVVTLNVNGLSTSTALSIGVIAATFTLASTSIVLTENSSQTIRNQQLISNISVPEFAETSRAADYQWRVMRSGDPIFSANPAPMISFSTNAITTTASLGSTAKTAQLYFSIAPDQTGTATLTLQLASLTGSNVSQQTMVVQVNPMAVPPIISQVNTSIQNLIVNGGRLYAKSVTTAQSVTPFLAEARALGGHLANINSIEEFNFLNSTRSGLGLHLSWIGLTLPQLSFPGELFWITNDSTIAYGFSSVDGASNFNIYPGHYALNWHSGDGLVANRVSSRPSVFNWAVYSGNFDRYFLIGDRGDSTRRPALYEFPQGLAPTSITSLNVFAGSSVTIRLTGVDLNGGTINTTDWTSTATIGTVRFNNVSQTSGVQTVDMVYTPPIGFIGQSSVVVTLNVNGLSTSTAFSFGVTAVTFTLASTSIVLTENSTQSIRNQQLISNISVPDFAGTTRTADYQWRVTQSGDPIFSANPAPIISFSTNALTTTASLGSTAKTAQLYFSIAPDQTGTATLTLQLASLTSFGIAQQTLKVSVRPMGDVAPRIVPERVQNLVLRGGRLYANSVGTALGVNGFLMEARTLGGHLVNINSVEEFDFVHSTTTSGLVSDNAWFGLVLPHQSFPGELSWITNDSTIAYGYSSDTVLTNLNVYPGHFALTWQDPNGLIANRSNRDSTVFNATIYSNILNSYLLLDDSGNLVTRRAIYEFPQGIAQSTFDPIFINGNTSVTVRLTGFDLNGDAINTADWTSTATLGTVSINNVSQSSGIQTVDMVYTPPVGFIGRSTAVVILQVNGSTATSVLSFIGRNIPTFSLDSTSIVLTENSSQTIRNRQLIRNIKVPNAESRLSDIQLRLTHSGDPIFSANPTPVISFSTNAIVTTASVGSIDQTAQLYFTIAPDQTGTATLTVHLTNLTDTEMAQRTMVVSVNSLNVPPTIVPANSSLTNLVVHGGHLYANDTMASGIGISRFLTTARDLGGHLMNINSVEDFSFMRSTASGLVIRESWLGMVLPQRTFPGELSWITHDSTIAYGHSLRNGTSNLTVYPGHFNLTWYPVSDLGLRANRYGRPTTVSNWTIYAIGNGGTFFLIDDGGDGLKSDGSSVSDRNVIYEFPQGLTPTSINPISVNSGTNANLSLTGFDLNGDTISTDDWSITDPNGGSAIFNHTTGNTGVQTVNMIYTAPANFDGQTTVVVSLLVNGLTTTYAISFIVDGPPTIALSTNTITLAEEFSNFVIGTTVTDQGVSGSLPFSVQTAATGIVNLTTTINSIQFSGALNFNGRVTLTVQATDSAPQMVSTLVVVTVEGVNDTPTINVSTNNISILGGFSPITIDTTATDVEQGVLAFSVQSTPQGVVSISTRTNAIVLTPIVGGSGRTTLTISAIDDGSKTGIQTIAVNVIVMHSTTPVLTVSTNLIGLQEDFGSVVIGTTATDADTTGTLLVTVSSSTHLVNSVISTHSMTLSSVANLFGTTTLTVRARDDGGLFDSTEIVVVVQSINDTPTFTVSSQSVVLASMLNAAPMVLSVSVTDVEDGVLSYSISTDHNAVNTVITTTSLSISRRGLGDDGPQVILTLRTTDSDGKTASTNVIVTVPSLLILTTGIKTLDFAWSAVSTATHYRLLSNPTGGAGFVDLSTTDIVVSPNSTNIRQTTAQALVALHRYIPRVNNPQYGVNTCDATSCSATIRHNTVNLTNAQLNTMIGRLEASNSDDNDRLGLTVRLSGDGNTLAVGADLEDSAATGVNGAQNNNSATNSGAVYVFRRNGGMWSQQAYIKASNTDTGDQFGLNVSLSGNGNTLAVGAIREDSASTGINGVQNNSSATDSGAVYVFRFSNGLWSQQAYIKASNPEAFALFGRESSLSHDGNTLAVGALFEDGSSTGINGIPSTNTSVQDSGAAYIFRFNNGVWSQHAYIKASNSGAGDVFGFPVRLNDDGNTLAVGAVREDGSATGVNGMQDDGFNDSGAVYVFRFSTGSSTWSQQAYIKASHLGVGQFGFALSLSTDGNTLAVGASREDGSATGVNGVHDNNTTDTGAAYVFRFNNGIWSQQAYIKASNTGLNDQFGVSVSLSADGNTLAVGALNESGSSSGFGGINNDDLFESGAVYLFEFSGNTWSQRAYIKARDAARIGYFGRSVQFSHDGNTLAVGAWGVNNVSGAVYLY